MVRGDAQGQVAVLPPGPAADAFLSHLVRTHGRELLFRYRFQPAEGFDYVSPTSVAILGHTPDALYADPTLGHAVVHPEDRTLLEAAWRTEETELPPTVDRVRRADGSEAWLEVRRTAVFDPEGRLVAIEGIILDITRRQRAEEALRDALRLLQTSLDALPSGLAVLDAEGRILRVNDAWRRLGEEHGDPDPRHGVGRTYLEVCTTLGVPSSECGPLGLGVQQVLQGALPVFRLEYEFQYGGERRVHLVRVQATPTDAGGRALIIHEDVTEQRRAERGLLELERWRNEERAREIERLRDMNRFKTELLNTASHELNTPLTAMRLQLSRLSDVLGDRPEATRGFAVLERNLERLIRLVNDMLDVARLESGRIPHRPQPLDLARLLPEAVEALEENARVAGVAVATEVHGPLPVEGDPQRLLQVLLNLLGNALKFTPDGGRVDVRARVVAKEVQVEVQDTGIGFDPQRAPELFKAFGRLDEPTALRRGGTGLGLYISRAIAEQHGGRLEGASQGLGQGARFRLVLPLRATAGTTDGKVEHAKRKL